MKTFLGKKMSKSFEIRHYTYEEDPDMFVVKGSPSDIRKIIRIAEEKGFENFYDGKPIMREGRIYDILFQEGSDYYTVSRVA